MNKTMRKTSVLLLSLAAVTMLLVGCSEARVLRAADSAASESTASVESDATAPVIEPEAAPQQVGEIARVDAQQSMSAEESSTDAEPATELVEVAVATSRVAAGSLSEDELAGLVFMREEEKLAHDVYLTLYEQWGQETFANIAESEQTHTDGVAALLVAYGVDDPAVSRGTGEFADANLQVLYDQLVAQGSESLDAALRVGAAIEEIDILDLEHHISLTDNAYIIRVYENLKAGSENHLRAFTTVIERQSATVYQPDYLSQEAYDLIVSSSSGRRFGQN